MSYIKNQTQVKEKSIDTIDHESICSISHDYPVFKFFYSILTFIQEFYWNFGQFCRGNLCHCKDVLQYLTPDLWKASFDGNYRILVLNLVNSKTINRNQNQKFIYVTKNNTYIV